MQEQAQVMLDYPFPDERVFRYQAMQDILHHLVNDPVGEFTQKELAKATGADVSTISRSIELLDQLGVLSVTDEKPAKIAIDQDHVTTTDPLFTIPQEEFRKPVGSFVTEVSSAITAASDISNLVGVILFGSVARGNADRSSDIDLLVILQGDATAGRRLVSQLARDLEDQEFNGERYEFEVLIETVESASTHGDKLQEIFDHGIVLERSDALEDVRTAVYDTTNEVRE